MKTKVVTVAVAAVLAGCSTEADEAAEPSGYKIIDRQEHASETDLTVAVDTDEDLPGVFEEVLVDEATSEGAWYVTIVCGEDAADDGRDNLLTGRHAMGATGSAVTGLDDGESEYDVVDGASCPR
jgi:hypothetical protein